MRPRRGPRPDPPLLRKEERLLKRLRELGTVLVAYSGGTDSTLLLNEAVLALGADKVVAVTAVSEVFIPREKAMAQSICGRLGVKHIVLETKPLKNAHFTRNNKERCYHCKRSFLKRLSEVAKGLGIPHVIEASQTDDRSDYRPGARAVAESGALSPLIDARLCKTEVRRLSRYHGLPTADLPAAACLASRVPYGTKITVELLQRLAEGEEAVRKLGFRRFRLRHHDDVARLEFAPAEMERAFRYRASLCRRIRALGWNYVALDLMGYRQGSLNELL